MEHASIELKFENLRPIENTGFVRGECLVAYGGKNRNYTSIPKEVFEDAEKTVFGIPVVGNWIEDSTEPYGGRFGGHDVILEQKGNEITIKDSTVPFGFVPQDANPRWTEVVDSDGNSKSYYTVDVILWAERYPNQIKTIEEKKAGQSMEIMVTSGDWDEDYDYFNIEEFYYSALCLLGKDEENPEKNIEPCFEESSITVNAFSHSENFSQKISELKTAFEGGEQELKDDIKGDIQDTDLDKTPEDGEFAEEEVENIDDTTPEADETEKEFEDGEVETSKTPEITTPEEPEKNSYKEEFLALTEKYEALEDEKKELVKEVEELREFKKGVEAQLEDEAKAELIEGYSLLLAKKEIDDCIDESMSLADVEAALSKAYAAKSLEEAKKTARKEMKLPGRETAGERKVNKNRFAL